MNRATWIKAILAVIVLAGVGAAVYVALFREGDGPNGMPVAADPADPALVALGGRLYAANCASCHGARLEGEAEWRRPKADGSLRAPPHDASGHSWHHPDQQLFAYTKFGGARFARGAFKSNMPAFGGTLGEREIAAILAFIKSRWSREIRERQAAITEAYRKKR
jgi:mono/diheme cytochrome c family protein